MIHVYLSRRGNTIIVPTYLWDKHMGKGFGTPTNKKIGYVLALNSAHDIYAADRSFDYPLDEESEEPFIGVTNLLSSAHVWSSSKEAEKSLPDYISFLTEWMEEENLKEINFGIYSLEANKQGELITKSVNKMRLTKSAGK